jgi:hypothetical protein
LEMGIIGLFLWLIWTSALVASSWRVVRRLRGTPFLPVAFAFFWFAFVLLFPTMFQSLTGYQNFVSNAYLWLTTGMLFGLPRLAREMK